MILRLHFLALILLIMFAMLIGGVKLVGSLRPTQTLLSVVFTNPDGSPCHQPCMFGVYPGQMTFDQAVAALKLHPYTAHLKQDADSNQIYKGESFTIHIASGAIYVDLTLLHAVGRSLVSAPQEIVRSGDIITFFGPADSVELENTRQRGSLGTDYSFDYSSRGFATVQKRLSADYVLPEDELVSIFVSDQLTLSNRFWRGFGRANRYPLRTPYR